MLFSSQHPSDVDLRAPASTIEGARSGTPIALCKIRIKHILNAQVSIRAPCCKQWYDCAECHAEAQDHQLRKTTEMAFMCKKCKKAFRKDMSAYEESDEYCPHCDNHYVLEAKTPHAAIGVEGDDPRINARHVALLMLLKDERVKTDPTRSLFAQDTTDRLG
ncbi:hypothetical protein EIP91_009283 [Steccherinum ochraceum]|uniref:CHY-type domain-containing protein n=1 Tax=Steccherinum ochraceum TaxID=92696 RepID=A0A4R0R1T7_9APHY|nr:hypothetical protein EIP91_009283 [Steccherinum ochraceum]